MSSRTFKFIVNVDLDDEQSDEEAFNAVWDAIEGVRFVTNATGDFL